MRLVAGIDEAGRGPLAGPVAAAAVILDPETPIEGLADSKRLTARRRVALYEVILDKALILGFWKNVKNQPFAALFYLNHSVRNDAIPPIAQFLPSEKLTAI